MSKSTAHVDSKQPPADPESERDGLRVLGYVTQRRRKVLKKDDGSSRVIITYVVKSSRGDIFLTAFDHKCPFAIGCVIDEPVSCRGYKRNDGTVGMSITVDDGTRGGGMGEEF